ncbi:MAG TPA: tetratricopeptide repeat protein [Actinomycetes bacterium]|nr:tetratricopeptide repeat protein [Actinomycetes bacterium]
MSTPMTPRGSAGPAINVRGAVDLAAVAAANERRAAAEAASASGANAVSSLVVDVTEATFQAEIIERSQTVPVVIDFWAEWCGPCKQLSPVLEKLVEEYDGRWLLAKVDVDAEQRLGAAFGVQSIPTLVAVVGGQMVPLFQGAVPEPQVRQVLDELLRVAEANGVSGRLTRGEPADGETAVEPAEPALPPDLQAAEDAMLAGDYDGAATAYRAVLATRPADEVARLGLARVELLARTQDVDPAAARTAAAENPADVAAQIVAADLDLLGGHVEDAFARLIDTVRATSGEDRNTAREHLIALFDVVGPEDPRVGPARLALANALF